ncbi:MAG: histidinol-phosphate transaminase [Sphaerochaetaceae bacterium]|nr:histidinol-phosphate transaminase [Sphaerochaetaceae bacterium]
MRELLRKNIAGLVPYSCARNDFKGTASVFLDANENWQDFVKQPGRNRYPDPLSTRLRAEIEKRMGLKAAHTVIGNGSDEVIDNLVRMFCVPGKDHVLLLPPTYGAYRVFCDINDVKVDVVPLTADFQLDMQAILAYLRNEKQNRKEGAGRLKLLFICSPNNPTANAFPLDQVEEIARNFDGITIVDEAYHDFSSVESAVSLQPRYPNLVVLRTLSKCWALAGARIGILVASEEICAVMASMKYPYNVSSPAQDAALEDLANWEKVMAGKEDILKQRPLFAASLAKLSCVEKVYPSDANFLLVKVRDANKIYAYLMDKGIIVRNRSKELHCENCLRITVGNATENQAVIDALKEWKE